MSPIQLWLPFVAGILSFTSPCVWPLVPGYLSFLAGLRRYIKVVSSIGAGTLIMLGVLLLSGQFSQLE